MGAEVSARQAIANMLEDLHRDLYRVHRAAARRRADRAEEAARVRLEVKGRGFLYPAEPDPTTDVPLGGYL